MKKALSLVLSALMFTSALTACSPAEIGDTKITLASSDAEVYVPLIEERLGTVPEGIIMGIGSSEEYGIDMSDFDEEGYILRSMGDATLIFGATADGLDRAVRAYTKAVNGGTAAGLSVVFGEGTRIDRLTIGGRDIADYTIVYESDGNTKYAAEEFRRLLEIATGISLPVETLGETAVSDKFIKILCRADGDLGENGAEYTVENGNVIISGVGCVNAVYHFFECACGWDGLLFGDSFLCEADSVDVPEGTSAVVDPMFDYTRVGNICYDGFDTPKGDGSSDRFNAFASHSLNKWMSEEQTVCYTDEAFFNSTYEKISSCVKEQNDIGQDLLSVDLGMAGAKWCTCSDCLELYESEGTNAAAAIQFYNRIIEGLYGDGLGGAVFTLLADSSVMPPKAVKPHDDLWITFCDDGAASSEIKGSAEQLESWCSIAANVLYCHHDKGGSFCTSPDASTVYDDLHFLGEIGVKGFASATPYRGEGFGRLRSQLMSAVIWNPDATEAEYTIMKEQIMEREYGDGWEYVSLYIDLAERIGDGDSCTDGTSLVCAEGWDTELYAEYAPDMEALLLKAKLLTSTSSQDDRITRLLCEVYYGECFSQYFIAETAENELLMKYLTERYALFTDALASTDYATDGEALIAKLGYVPGDDIHAEAEKLREEFRDTFDPERVAHDYNHVVIIGVDGAGRVWNDDDAPFVIDFFSDGFVTNMFRVANPTISGFNWASLMTGVNPQIHGVSNASDPYNNAEYPTFFKLLRDADPTAEIASFCNWGFINGNIIEHSVNIVRGGASSDETVCDQALAYLEDNTPELLFVCFDEVDSASHGGGVVSPKTRAALSNADEYISYIFDVYEEKGIADDTLFIVTADHGHQPVGGHGGQTNAEKYATFFIKGKTVTEVNGSTDMNIRDVAAIVTHALCIDGNEDRWDSRIPEGMFTDIPEGQPRLDYHSTADHETAETPSGDKALENYVDTSKLEAALFFDGDLSSEYDGITPVAKEEEKYVDGYYGGALDISKAQCLTFDDAKFGADSFSIALWVKEDIDYYDFDNTALYGNKVIADTAGVGFMLEYAYDSEFYLGDGTDGHYNTFGLPDDYDKTNWYHTLLVVDRDAGTVSMYYNFKLNSTHDISKFDEVSLDSALPFVLGADGTGSSGIDAQLDDFLLFGDALTKQEIDSFCSYYFE